MKGIRYQVSGISSQGFTALELIAAVAILSALAVVVIDPIRTFRNNQQMTGTTEEITALFHEARANTLASKDGAQWGVYIVSDRAALYKTSYATTAPDTKSVIFPNPLMIDQITLVGGGTTVLFDRLTGKTSQSGSFRVRLRSDAAQSRLITILSSGSVSVSR